MKLKIVKMKMIILYFIRSVEKDKNSIINNQNDEVEKYDYYFEENEIEEHIDIDDNYIQKTNDEK